MAEQRPAGASSAIRQALEWLSSRRQDDPDAPRMKLIEEAAVRFDLTPVECDFLATNWKEH